jgi:hypothetical protein
MVHALVPEASIVPHHATSRTPLPCKDHPFSPETTAVNSRSFKTGDMFPIEAKKLGGFGSWSLTGRKERLCGPAF